MYKPELYIKSNRLARNTAVYVLKKHVSLLTASDNHAVVDVGCGPGNITFENILPLLPKTTKKLIGVDVSTVQVEYAKTHYGEDPRISYQELDVTTDALPNDFIGTFDLAISLFCLHCVKDQRKAVTNLCNMLKPGGELLISLITTTTFRELDQFVYNNPKWSMYMSNFNSSFVQASVQYYKNLFEEVGFDKVEITETDNVHECSEEEIFDMFTAINMLKVPEDLLEVYIQDLVNYSFTSGYGSIDKDGQRSFKFPYTVLIITAIKS